MLVGDMYNRYFEVIFGYWLINVNQFVMLFDYKIYGGLLGGLMDFIDFFIELNY